MVSGCHWGAAAASLAAAQSELLFVSISFHVFLSERFLGTADQTSHVVRRYFQRGGDFLIAEFLSPQQQDLRISPGERAEHAADAPLFGTGGVDVLWCGRR